MKRLHREYLSTMGIQVWQKRKPIISTAGQQTALGATAVVAKPQTSLASESSQQLGAHRDQDQAIAIARPYFLLYFVDYPHNSFVLSFAYDTTTLPTQHRRFVDDVYFAMTRERYKGRVRELRWPMVKSTHMMQTDTEARTVVTQTMQSGNHKYLLFGKFAGCYCSEHALALYQTKNVGKHSLTWVEDSHLYVTQPYMKRKLWQALQCQNTHPEMLGENQ